MIETDRKELKSLPVTLVLQLEERCDQFEAAWQSEDQRATPQIEDFLRGGSAAPRPGAPASDTARDAGAAPAAEQQATDSEPAPTEKDIPAGSGSMDSLRRALVRELVLIDVAYRRRAGEAPHAEDYLDRFPDLDRAWLVGVVGAGPAPTTTASATEIYLSGSRGCSLSGTPPPADILPSHPGTVEEPVGTLAAAAIQAFRQDQPPGYEILGELGRGSMGVVYKARQKGLDRLVALKMITSDIPLTAEAVMRFHREARAAAALDHPNIVAIYAPGEHNGRPFFVMAYVEGETIRQLIQRDGRPSPIRAAELVAALADAVHYAHQRGIVHRDLKPENVLLDAHGRPRVTDFGLAYHLGTEGDAERLTHAGAVMGTPAYMSPEQAKSSPEAVGPATDVYSLGGILYFLLTGRPPFQGRCMSDVLIQVTTEAPTPPHQVSPQVPAALEAVCLRCLAKEPARRPATAEALAEDLRDAVRVLEQGGAARVPDPPAEQPLTPPPVTTGAGHQRWWIGLAAALLVGVGAGVWLAATSRTTEPAPPVNPRPDGSVPAPVAKQLPLPEKLRTDFGLEVTMLGKVPGKEGFVPLQPGPDGILTLREQDEVKFRIKVDRPAHVGIWSINADGSICQLFPNQWEQDHLFKPGVARVVPQTDAVAGKTKEKTTFDWIWVQASTKPWDSDRGQRERESPFLLFKTERERRAWAESRGEIKLRPASLSESILKFRVGSRQDGPAR